MQLCDIFLRLGEETFSNLLRTVSLGKLKTYQLFDRLKTRLYLHKLNSETLRKSAPRSWARLGEHDDEFATELAQAILVSHLDMIQAVLNHLGVPHQDGFFDKDANVEQHLKAGWQEDTWKTFQTKFPPAALLFYINHLGWEVTKSEEVFLAPAA
jgi:hypothetical protein